MAGPASTAAAASVPEHALRREGAGEAAKKQAEEEKAAKRKQDEEKVKRNRLKEELERRQAEEEVAQKRATEEAMRKKQAEDEEEAVRKKQAERSTPGTPPRPTSSRSPRTVRPTQNAGLPRVLGDDNDTAPYVDEYFCAVQDPYQQPADLDDKVIRSFGAEPASLEVSAPYDDVDVFWAFKSRFKMR